MTALKAACDFLDDYLGNGPKPSLEVAIAADQNGISEATLRRATQARRVRRTRPHATGPWFMYLPNAHVPVSSRRYASRTSTMAATRAAIDADEDRDYDDDEEPDDDDEPDYEPAAGAPWGWIIGVAVLVCGFGSIIFVRRWLPVVAD